MWTKSEWLSKVNTKHTKLQPHSTQLHTHITHSAIAEQIMFYCMITDHDRKSARSQSANLGRAKATLEFGGQVRVGGLVFLLAHRLLHGDLAS